MKLRAAPRGTSFYESFSDLIFGSLVLFLVMVLALSLKVQAAGSEQPTVEEVLDPYRFAGESTASSLYVGLLPYGAESAVVWIPAGLAASWSLRRKDGGNDPVLRLCELFRDGELLITPESDVRDLATGVSPALFDCYVNYISAGALTHLLVRLREDAPDQYARMSAEELKQYCGGVEGFQGLSQRAYEDFLDYREWDQEADGSLGRRGEELFDSLTGAGPASDELVLRFHASPEGLVRIGTFETDLDGFRALLGALNPGAGFVLEYTDTEGTPAPAPQHVRQGILAELGFSVRVLSAEGRRALDDA